MRLALLSLACLAALAAVPSDARAESAREKFDRLVNEPGNQDAFLYADGKVVGPTGQATPNVSTQEGFSESFGVLIHLQHAPRGGLAQTDALTRFGSSSADTHALDNGDGASAESSGAFRDFWTFTGGTGTGTLVVRGFSSAELGGDQINQSAQEATLSSTGSFGSLGASFAMTFAGGDAAVDVDTQCGPSFNSRCEINTGPGRGTAMWSLNLPFDYGGSASFVSRLATSMVTDTVGPDIFGLQHSSSGITAIELPEGATLRAASNQVVFSDGVWVYSDRHLPPPIPEPSAWALMAAGLAAVTGACCWRRSRPQAKSDVPSPRTETGESPRPTHFARPLRPSAGDPQHPARSRPRTEARLAELAAWGRPPSASSSCERKTNS